MHQRCTDDALTIIGGIRILGELNVKFQSFVSLSLLAIFAFLIVLFINNHLASNNIACCVAFVRGGLRNTHGMARHTKLSAVCSMTAKVHAETEVCRHFKKAVVLVPVEFGYNLLSFIDFVAFCCFFYQV